MEERLCAMEAARPDEALTLYDQAARYPGAGGPGAIEAQQLWAFEEGDPHWWEALPGGARCDGGCDGGAADAVPSEGGDANGSSTTQAKGLS